MANNKSWLKSVVEDFNTGGKNHYIWEGIENMGKSARDSLIESAKKPTEQKNIDTNTKEYLEQRNAPPSQQSKQDSNITTLALVGVGAYMLLGS